MNDVLVILQATVKVLTNLGIGLVVGAVVVLTITTVLKQCFGISIRRIL